MTQASNPSRRQALKFLAGVPMLPVSGLAASSLLTACGGGGGSTPTPTFVSATFGSMDAPTTIANRATTYVASTLSIKLSDNTTQKFNLAYKSFFLTGQEVDDINGGKILAGGYFDFNGNPILDTSRQFFSDSPDGTSLLTVPNASVAGVTGNHVFAVVQFEYTTLNQARTSMYGRLPSPIAVLTLDQNPSTGELKLVKYHNVDTSSTHGLWITCGASLSPWGTHLSSEEYEPDAFAPPSYYADFKAHLNDPDASIYHYGHLPEVTVLPNGKATIKKHYCLGRISHELVQVMPDSRTVLMGDDATNGGLFLFIADTAKDLSAGTLYVAQLQDDFNTATLGGTASVRLKWIKLGHATSDEIEALIDTIDTSLNNQIMDVKFADPSDPSYTKIFNNGTANWVKLVAGQEKAAAFLETHRYAYLKGGSMGLTKLEGTTVNIKDKIAYSALQNMEKSMVTSHAEGWNAASRIGLSSALKAGGVLAHSLGGGQVDTDGANISSEWVPTSFKVLLKGVDISADALGNTANPDKIANPDNLKFSEKMRTLFIGEDSGQHSNNFLWAYNVDTPNIDPVRILSVPAGGESTGLHAVDEINGWTYIMSNFQHAGDSDYVRGNATLDSAVKANYNDNYAAAVGYLTATSTSIKLGKL